MLHALTAGLVLGLSGGLLPGPLLTAVLTQTLRHGAREGIRTSFAPLLSDGPIIAVLIAFVGYASRFRSAVALIGILGAVYLLVLARESWTSRPPDPGVAGTAAPRSLLRGMLVNFMNPNVYIFWLTVGVPTLTKAWSESHLAAVAFVVVFFVCLIGSKIAIAVFVARSRELLKGRWYTLAMRGLAVMLVVYAALMVRDAIVA